MPVRRASSPSTANSTGLRVWCQRSILPWVIG
jgi:hypothetical protein